MREFLSIYWFHIKTFFKSRAEYRASFFTGLFANFYSYFLMYATFWIIVQKLSGIAGWDFQDMSLLYGLNMLTYSLAGTLIWYTVYHLDEMITKGELDRFLVRPEGVLRQLMFQRFGDTFIGQIVVTIIFISMTVIIKIEYFTPVIVVYFIFAVIGGIFMQCGAMIIMGSISFWTLRSKRIGSMLYYDLRGLTQHPLTIYPKWIKIILSYVVPWAFINYYPAMIILNKYQTTSDYIHGLIAPFVGIGFFFLALFVFRRGLNRYSGAGS